VVGVNENASPFGTIVIAIWDTDASLATVSAFYSTRLREQPWAITDTSAPDGTWVFQRTDGKMNGLIRLSGHGQGTRITVSLFN
jgi:hypothetical protein